MVVPLRDIPEAAKRLEAHGGERNLRCEVDPSKPWLNFGLRFQAGYRLQAPLVQYSGAGHNWQIVLGVTPETAGADPTYLADHVELPSVPHPEYSWESVGTFVLGEGRYRVAFAAVDDLGRVCRKEWTLDAAARPGSRAVKAAIPPNTVADLSYSEAPASTPPGPPVPRRLTVLMNGSIPYTLQNWPSRQEGVVIPRDRQPEISAMAAYRAAMPSILASLLESLPSTVIRLVVFDYDQQKETLRQDNFALKDIEKAAHAANNTEHWPVTVRELQEQPGQWGLLANLIRREIAEKDPSDAVVFLGPRIAAPGNLPPHFLELENATQPRFLYLQYNLSREGVFVSVPPEMGNKPPDERLHPMFKPLGGPDPLDAIDLVVRSLKGKTWKVYSPAVLAKAIEALKHS